MLSKENKDEIIEFLIDRIRTIDGKLDDVISTTCYYDDYDDDDDDCRYVSCDKSKSLEEIKDYCQKTLMEVSF
jgi:hypothetical protein